MIYLLRAINRELAWEKLIKPGIKQNLIGALLASQENMVNRKNSFQLYGADFLIMDDLSVWLIEINTNPRLHPPSSSVTEKLYPEIIEDTIKGSQSNFFSNFLKNIEKTITITIILKNNYNFIFKWF